MKKHAKSGIYSIRSSTDNKTAMQLGTRVGGGKTNMVSIANQLIFNDLSSSGSAFEAGVGQRG
ncbi:hypothetical protein ACMGG8_17550 [Pseudomonas sp. BNK-45]|uniref:hypothetical protein n=1 Tax=Pseudomonas sp. BNK-45 TaxID=3376180 RepID=UPI0039BF861F